MASASTIQAEDVRGNSDPRGMFFILGDDWPTV